MELVSVFRFNNKKIELIMKKIFLIWGVSISLASCSLDENVSPNTTTTDNATPDLILGGAETGVYRAQVSGRRNLNDNMFKLSNIWMNAWAGNEYYFASPLSSEYQMDLSTSFYASIWEDNYLSAANLSVIINNKQKEKYAKHVVIAKILMANTMQYIVDFYGDAPYSEAFREQGNISPVYDDDADIYKALVEELNEAIKSIDAGFDTSVKNVASEDVIFQGNMSKWKKLANTIKLRLLLRQSKVTNADIVSFRDAQLATLENVEFIDEDVTINPGYSSSSQVYQNPMYKEYGARTSSGALNTYGWRLYKLSDHYAKLLLGDTSKPTSGVVDHRIGAQFQQINGVSSFKGIVQGGGKVNGTGEFTYASLGWNFSYGNSGIQKAGSAMDGYIMTKVEARLLRAEAAVLYPSIFSDGQVHYEQSIHDSYAFYLPENPSLSSSYLAALNASGSDYSWNVNPIAAIQLQRLVGLIYTRPMETYINYLKTGYPQTPLALTTSKSNKPYRLMYPASETTANSANVPKVSADQCFEKNEYTPFWNKN